MERRPFSPANSPAKSNLMRSHQYASSPALSNSQYETTANRSPKPTTTSTGLSLHITLRTIFMILITIGTLATLVAYSSIYWSVGRCTNELNAGNQVEFSKEWLQYQWITIVDKEKRASDTTKQPIDFKKRQQLDATRPILTASMSDKSIQSFNAFSVETAVNVWDLYPPNANCPDMTRIGLAGDGGKWVCGAEWLANRVRKSSSQADIKGRKRTCVMYSFGINNDISFESRIRREIGCEIHAFDPTIGSLPDVPIWPPSRRKSRNPGIFFHKLALGNISGTNSEFSLIATLQDIMFELGHSYIDLLKIDIEGSEWNVFDQIFLPLHKSMEAKSREYIGDIPKHNSNNCIILANGRVKCNDRESLIPLTAHHEDASWTLPFGQLFIELHYSTMPKIDRFFSSMFRAGFVIFSREINLAPCLSGNLPLASEYSFINPQIYFLEDSQLLPKHLQQIPAALTPSFHESVSGVIYFLTQKKRLFFMQGALELLYENFWLDYGHYPVVIFHDDLGPIEQNYLQNAVPLMKLHFILFKFHFPKNMNIAAVPNRTKCDPSHSSIGYRHMCRFHTTVVHELLAANGYGSVEYIMRLDDDSVLPHPIGYDLFRFMKLNKKLYGFVRTIQDAQNCVHGLWNLAGEFLNRSAEALQINRTETFFDKWPEGLVIFNNFEISHTSIWKNPIWKHLMAEIDASAGIYMLRWGDAPIHTIAISLILKTSQVHRFGDISYSHNYCNQTAEGLPKPNIDPFSTVHCYFYDRWICSYGSNSTNSTNSTLALHNPIWSSSLNQRFFFNRIGGAPIPPSAYPLQLSEYIKGNQRGVLYTFGHGGREDILAQTLNGIYESFTKQFQYPIVVFHSNGANPQFDIDKVVRLVNRDVASTIKFFPVNLIPYQKKLDPTIVWPNISKYKCVSMNREVYGAIKFLQFDAMRHLGYMGYDWYLRISDSIKLKPIQYDLFEAMAQQNSLYGYLVILKESSNCVTAAWELMYKLCKQAENSGMTPGCGNALSIWPKGTVALSLFEISHHSVWRHPICEKLRHIVEASDGIEGQVWGDTLVHTLCVMASLQKTQFRKMDNVNVYYDDFWRQSNASKVSIPVYNMTSLPELDSMFMPRRFGWLAGDMGYSFAFPSLEEAHQIVSARKSGNYNLPKLYSKIKKYVWLFGDSLIGTSTPERRLEGKLISNAVGIADMKYDNDGSSTIKSLHIFWGMVEDGAPRAVFVTESMVVTNYSFASNSMHLTRSVRYENSSEGDYGASNFIFNRKRKFKHGKLAPREGQRLLKSTHSRDEVTLDHVPSIWPAGGISVVIMPTYGDIVVGDAAANELPSVKVIVIGQLVTTAAYSAEFGISAALSFIELSSVVFIVGNPVVAPAAWEYGERIIIPAPRKGQYKWFTLVESQGNPFAFESDMLYILGSYNPHTVDPSDPESSLFDLFGHNVENAGMVISRIPASSAVAGNFHHLQVACTSINVKVEWKPLSQCTSPWQLFAPMITEPSLHWDKANGEWVITSLEVLEKYIRVCRSSNITGPWTCFNAGDMRKDSKWGSDKYIQYGAKWHPELRPKSTLTSSGKDKGMVVSYIPNTVAGPSVLYSTENNEAYTLKFMHLERIKSKL